MIWLDVSALLWILFAINTAIYVYVGRFVISKPRHQHPALFWNPAMLYIAAFAPPFVFAALVVAGFVLTYGGWALLIASVIAFIVFAVRPAREFLPWWAAGISDLGEPSRTTGADNPTTSGAGPSPVFMGSMPDPDGNTPTVIPFGDMAVWYYEHPQTIGDKVGIPALFKYRQLAVFRSADGDPYLIVRVEDWHGSSRMLCSVEPSGGHRTIGPWSSSDRKAFVERAAEIASAIDGPEGKQ